MERGRVEALHQAASEYYLRGEFGEALAAWRAILHIDPKDEQAIEGVRLSEIMSAGRAEPMTENVAPSPPEKEEPSGGNPSEAVFEVERSAGFEEALSVLDSIAPRKTEAPAPEKATPPHVESGPIGVTPSEPPSAGGGPRPPVAGGDDPPDWDPCPASAAPAETGLAPLSTVSAGAFDDLDDLLETVPPMPSAAVEPGLAAGTETASESGAQEELRRRVQDLLRDARVAAEASRIDDAIAILQRVFILDEENAEAVELEESLRRKRGEGGHDIESWLSEATQFFAHGRLEDARDLFQRVLERMPGHGEAIDAIEKIDAAIAARESGEAAGAEAEREDRFAISPKRPEAQGSGGSRTFESVGAEAVPLASPTERPRRSTSPIAASADADEVAEAPAPPRARRVVLWALSLSAAALVVAGALFLMPRLLGGSKTRTEAATGRPAMAKIPASKAATAAPAPPPSSPASLPATKASAPAVGNSAFATYGEAITEGRAAVERGEWARAVLAFDAATRMNPESEEARKELRAAGEGYKAWKAERQQVDDLRGLYSEGDYAGALRVLYRLPGTIKGLPVDRFKVNAWYNLGLESLRAGRVKEAIGHFDEALAIAPDDAGARKAGSFAQEWLDRARDRSYYDPVESMPFRKIDD